MMRLEITEGSLARNSVHVECVGIISEHPNHLTQVHRVPVGIEQKQRLRGRVAGAQVQCRDRHSTFCDNLTKPGELLSTDKHSSIPGKVYLDLAVTELLLSSVGVEGGPPRGEEHAAGDAATLRCSNSSSSGLSHESAPSNRFQRPRYSSEYR